MKPKEFSKEIDQIIENQIKQEVLNEMKNQKPKKEVIRLSESDLLQVIQRVIAEEKKHPGMDSLNKIHKENGKINKAGNRDSDSNSGSLNKGVEKPEFPNAISKGEKKAHQNSEEQEEFVDDFKGSGMEDIKYREKPTKEFSDRAEKALTGDKKMGNASGEDTANTIKTKTGEDMVKKAKRKKEKEETAPMYKKEEQPTGKQKEDKHDSKKFGAVNESVLDNELAKIKKLYSYSDRTQ